MRLLQNSGAADGSCAHITGLEISGKSFFETLITHGFAHTKQLERDKKDHIFVRAISQGAKHARKKGKRQYIFSHYHHFG